ncbi:MAG: hypothetical protein IPK81_13980 [Rhodospirillales bacterium]|nr:MAG: hypothetical protein IPK81_13980 [Rhodospirillales bacterium]
MSGDLEQITTQEESARDTQVARLENDLQKEKDSRKSERFVWALVVIITVDLASLKDAGWAMCLVVLIFEFILVLVLGKVWGFDEIYTILQNAIDAANRLRNGQPKPDTPTDKTEISN